jgi:hypothetical protein
MKNYKFWLIVVLTLLVVNSVVLAIMWFHRHPRGERRGEMQSQAQQMMEPKDVLIKTLAFTPKQAILFDTLRHQHRALVKKLEGENHILRDSLFTYIKKPKADTAVINAISKKISDNQAGIEKATLYHFRDVRATLTTAQQTKFDSIINQVLQMMGRPGPPQGGPPQGRGGLPGRNGRGSMQGPQPADNMPPGRDRHNGHFGPPPEGMPPPPLDKDGHPLPPPDGRGPGPDGRPLHGPPPGGGRPNAPPPNGPPPNGGPPQGPPPDGKPPL